MKIFLLLLIFLLSAFSCAEQVPWERLELLSAYGFHTCSSELDAVDPFEGIGKYGPHNLLDADPATAWVEGVDGDGIGESVTIEAGETLEEAIIIRNGYQKSQALFNANSRVKKLRLTLFAGFMIPGDVTELYAYFSVVPFGEPVEIELEDKSGIQWIEMPFDLEAAAEFKEQKHGVFLREAASRIEEIQANSEGFDPEPKFRYFLKCEILEVYKGSKYDDTCISDIWFGKNIRTDVKSIPKKLAIVDIVKDDDEAIVYAVTEDDQRFMLADEEALAKDENLPEGVFLYLEIMDISPDKEWVQIDYMYRQEEEARIEEIGHLYSARYLRELDLTFMEEEVISMFGFMEYDSILYLEYGGGSLPLKQFIQQLENE
jgi:hypothetical protein